MLGGAWWAISDQRGSSWQEESMDAGVLDAAFAEGCRTLR